MKKNMGTPDRLTRLALAAVLVVVYVTGTVTGIMGTIFLIVAGIFVLTSLIGLCPLYLPFGFKTCSTKEGE